MDKKFIVSDQDGTHEVGLHIYSQRPRYVILYDDEIIERGVLKSSWKYRLIEFKFNERKYYILLKKGNTSSDLY